MMKAELMTQYGGPEVLKLEEIRQPELQPDEALIRVRGAAVNPIDWKIREGDLQDSLPVSFPLIPGWDVAGTIEEIGEQVDRFRKGDAVYALLEIEKNGAYAEYARAPSSILAPMPETLDFISAASVPMAGLTAFQSIEKMALQNDQVVLIHGAAGAVGSFAVQLAHLKGAYVIALASPGDGAYLVSLGADEVHTYDSGPFEHKVQDADAILDVIGGDILQRSWKVLKDGGILVSTVDPPSDEMPRRKKARAELMQVRPDANMLSELARLIDAGELKVRVGTVLSLDEAAKAQEIARSAHHRGKVVLKVA